MTWIREQSSRRPWGTDRARRLQAALDAVHSAVGRALVQQASTLEESDGRAAQPSLWSWLAGRATLFRGTGRTSLAARLAVQVQQRAELPVWVTADAARLHLPDLLRLGLDPRAFPVVCLPTPEEALKAAERLTASQGFGLVVVDIPTPPRRRMLRLVRLAAETRTPVLVLLPEGAASPMAGPRPTDLTLHRLMDGTYRCTLQGKGLAHSMECPPLPELTSRGVRPPEEKTARRLAAPEGLRAHTVPHPAGGRP